MHLQNKNYKFFLEYFNKHYADILTKYIHDSQPYIKEAIIYSLQNGKRLRPIIILSMCNSICKDIQRGLEVALAVELIHTATLIIDDLPSMDNDTERRNQPSFHIKYSIFNSNIISMIMINIAIKLIHDSFKKYKMEKNLRYLTKNISHNLGIVGLSGGQLIDLTPFSEFSLKNGTLEEKIDLLIHMKTTSLFEISFVAGYLLCEEYDETKLSLICKLSKNFGLSFQIYDDFQDIEQDKLRIDNNLFDPNYINNFGISFSKKIFNENLNSFIQYMKSLDLFTEEIIEICFKLTSKLKQF